MARAIMLVLFANLMFAVVDSSTKWLLGAGLAVAQLAFLRYALHLVVSLGEAGLRRGGIPKITVRLWGLLALRAFFIVAATLVNFFALGKLPLAVTSAVLFLSPIFVCLFAWAFLGEVLDRRKIIAVCIGFFGVLVILNPFQATINWYVVLMICPAACMALYVVMTRGLAAHTSPWMMQFSTGVLGTLALLPFGVMAWRMPETGLAWTLALGIGIFAWIGHEALTRAHALAEASSLAPYTYSLIIFMSLAGWLIFEDIPSLSTVLGALCIISAGLIVFWQPAKRTHQ